MVSNRFRRPKGITSAPQTPNMQHLTHPPSYPLRALFRLHSILKTVFLTRFGGVVNTGQHLLTKNIFVEKIDFLSFLTHFLPCIHLKPR